MSLSHYSFGIEDAIKFGAEEAIILHHFRYWIATNRSNNKHDHDGRFWLYNSHKGLSELFPFFNEQKCKRLIQSLKDQGAILVGNFNKSSYDRTNWYTVNDESSVSQINPFRQSNMNDGRDQNDRPIPITTITTVEEAASTGSGEQEDNSIIDPVNKIFPPTHSKIPSVEVLIQNYIKADPEILIPKENRIEHLREILHTIKRAGYSKYAASNAFPILAPYVIPNALRNKTQKREWTEDLKRTWETLILKIFPAIPSVQLMPPGMIKASKPTKNVDVEKIFDDVLAKFETIDDRTI